MKTRKTSMELDRETKYPNKDLVGQTFGKLKVLEFIGRSFRSTAFWLCICECGRKAEVRDGYLKIGKTKSCGCNRHYKKGEASKRSLYNQYKSGAKNRGYEFVLTLDQFNKITKQKCCYCGIEPSTIKQQNGCDGEYIYNGIDRVDNNDGYTIDNVVTCCTKCNFSKGTSTKEEFYIYIKRLMIFNKDLL